MSKKHKAEIPYYDMNQHYLINMGEYLTDASLIECKIKNVTNHVISFEAIENPERYGTYSYYHEFFNWLLTTNKIIKLENKS